MIYKIEDVYNIAEEMTYVKEENVIRGHVTVDVYYNEDEPADSYSREYEINKDGFKWIGLPTHYNSDDGDPDIDYDWDDARFEVDEAFFNHFKNADKVWKRIRNSNEY